MSQADFNKFLKLEKRLGKLIDNPRGSSSRALMKRKDNLRRRLKLLEPKIKGFEDGGLAMAIEKVKAKEMKDGGNVPKPKLRPKSLKADKTESLDKEFSKNVARTNKKNAENVKKMKFGGKVKKMREGGSAMSDANREMIQAILGESGKKISDADRASMLQMMGESGKTISDADRERMMMIIGSRKGMKYGGKVKKMKVGGEAVPSKFKGFSKLPEKVQQKMDPDLASKYKMGGKVEEYGGGGSVKGGKMSCRGMGAAIKGGGFSIR